MELFVNATKFCGSEPTATHMADSCSFSGLNIPMASTQVSAAPALVSPNVNLTADTTTTPQAISHSV